MTYCDVFVGRLKAGFDWDNPADELKRENVEFLTDTLMDQQIYRAALNRAKDGPHRYLDWGSVAVPVTRDEILAFMAAWRTGWDLPGPGDKDHKPKQSRARSLATVEALPPDKPYLLVTEEF